MIQDATQYREASKSPFLANLKRKISSKYSSTLCTFRFFINFSFNLVSKLKISFSVAQLASKESKIIQFPVCRLKSPFLANLKRKISFSVSQLASKESKIIQFPVCRLKSPFLANLKRKISSEARV